MSDCRRRRSRSLVSVVIGLTYFLVVGTAPAKGAEDPFDLAYDMFKLENGLTVVVHEDRKAPIVAVNVWYGVGSKDEPKGRSGFAHLFEHLMYNGTENYDDEFFGPLQKVGATSVNGSTWFDRTVYYETVPKTALDLVLWMESDRMGHLLPAVTQAKLDEQRSVVKNEKRQGENQPYGRVLEHMLKALFPEGHPYRHTTIGSMDDLNAASLEDVHAWFKDYYGAANAVLVLAGDISAVEARPLVEKYFGDIPAGPPLTKHESFLVTKDSDTLERMYDRVAQPRLYRQWVVPGRLSKDRALLDLAAIAFGQGKTSDLYATLVHDEKSSTDVYAYVQAQQLASFFTIIVDGQPGAGLDELSGRVDDLLQAFLKNGLSTRDLARIKANYKASVLRSLETVSSDDGVAGRLGQGALYAGDPGFLKTYMSWIDRATVQDVKSAANRWLTKGSHTIEVYPFASYSVAQSSADRSRLPFPQSTPDLTFPEVEQAVLSNGVRVLVANRPALPLVSVAVQFDAGHAADHGSKLGLGGLTLDMLDEGTATHSALELSSLAEALGAELGTAATLDTSTVTLAALKSNLAPSLDLLAEVLREPTFSETDLDRLRQIKLAGIAQEQTQPVQIGFRVLPPLLYGEEHAYGVPMTGTGTTQSLRSITRADLVSFHETWFGPKNATIIIVGDVTLAEVVKPLERALGRWRAAGTPPKKAAPSMSNPEAHRVILIDKPGSPQSLILAGRIIPSSRAANAVAMDAMDKVIGGEFSSRINLNLREDKGWSYGAFALLMGGREERPYFVYAPVQTDKTAQSITEIVGEIDRFLGPAKSTPEELETVKTLSIRELPGSFETNGSVLGSLQSSLRYGRALDYPLHLKQAYQALTLSDVNKAASEAFGNGALTWVVVGDLETIEEPVRALGLGRVEIRDLDGRRVR